MKPAVFQIRRSVKMPALLDLFACLCVAELVLGGSGRLLTFGPLSIRMLLMAAALAYVAVKTLQRQARYDGQDILLLLLFLYFVGLLAWSLLHNTKAYAIDEFFGLLPMLLCLFYVQYCRDELRTRMLMRVFELSVLLLSVISLLIWGYCLVRGPGVYRSVRAVLDHFVYGNLAWIGRIPRLFLKSSIFIPVGLMFSLDRFLNEKKLKTLILVGVEALALLSTFTVSFYVFGVFAFALYLFIKLKHEGNLSLWVTVLFILAAAAGVILISGVIDILLSRFAGNTTFDYKFYQAAQLIRSWSKSPLFGTGFGQVEKIVHSSKIYESYNFEVMWLQLLLHTGLIGFLLFVSHIVITLKKLRVQHRKTGQISYAIFWIGVIFVCLVSFTNPFMNNGIGLGFYALATGLANAQIEETGDKMIASNTVCTENDKKI